jgi:cytochrome P450
MQDPPEHDRMRKLVSRVFSPKAVAELEPMARAVIVGFLDEALADGQGAFDAVAQFSAPFPVEVISTMLGVPEGDRQQIRHWTDDLLHREPGVAEMTQAGMEAGLNMGVYFYGLAEEKRARPDDSMLCQLTQVEVARDDDGTMTRLTNEEIAGFATLLAGAGSETVTKLVGGGMVLFARNPSEWQKVLDDPVRINDATEEILRFWPPSQYQGRYSMRDSEWHGETIPAGMPVLLLTGAATHDERAFPEPDRFDIDRPHQLNVGFGHGIHLCLGAFLARMESRIAFEELRERVPNFEIDEDGLRRVHMSNVAGYSNVPVRAV